MPAPPKDAFRSRIRSGGELGLIRRIRERAVLQLSGPAISSGLRLGIGDDCAILRPRPEEEFCVTTDLSIAGRHFQLDWHPPESVGHRALARGLSDLAAMGARPVAAFLSLAVPEELTAAARRTATAGAAAAWAKWSGRFLDGLFTLAAASKTPLAGGDLAESPIALADIALVGAVPRGRALLRSAARPGHLLYVTGSLGGSAAALARLAHVAASSRRAESGPPRLSKQLAAALGPHLYPQPRIAQGIWLRRRGLAAAAIDLSDGLSTDLTHICDESHVAAEVDSARLPIHPDATLAQALNGGEDYELLFTAPAAARIPGRIAGICVTRIGRILAPSARRPTLTLLTASCPRPIEPQGWEHFA